MRSLEILILVVNLPLVVWALLPALKRPRWLDFTPSIALLLIIIHLFVEGYRWQMIPAYILIGLIFLLTLPRILKSKSEKSPHRVLSIVSGVLGLLFLGISFALPLLFPIFQFPLPGGPYKIGTVNYQWVDQSRAETFTDDPNDHRELMVQIWYPANSVYDAKPAMYISNADQVTPVLAKTVLGLPRFALNHIRYIHTNAMLEAPVSAVQSSYPVLIFSHGRGGWRGQNTLLVEELASWGYIVACIDHTYAAGVTAFSDGRVVPFDLRMVEIDFVEAQLDVFVDDVRFVLDQLEQLNLADSQGYLTDRLDLNLIGIFGHSLGGTIAAETCRRDERLKVGINLDGPFFSDVVENGFRQPFLILSRDVATMQKEIDQLPTERRQAIIDEHFGSLNAGFEKLQGEGYFLMVNGFYHFNFTDLPLLSPLTRQMGFSGPINIQRAHQIIKTYSLAFFDQYLKNQPSSLLDGDSLDYPEVQFTSRSP